MNAIAAIGLNHEIGKDNDLLFHIKEDMERFRTMTENKVVIMGRSTQQSLPRQKPLKNRENIVITRDMHYHPDGFKVIHSMEDVFDLVLSTYDSNEVFVIGGEQIYSRLLSYCDNLYLTLVHRRFPEADKYFPKIEERQWEVFNKDYRGIDKSTALEYEFLHYVRIDK